MTQKASKKRNYRVFIPGEHINLCIPSAEAIELDGWADWFNNIERSVYSAHGVFPNFPETQLKFLERIQERKSVVLLLCDKSHNIAFGVVSLQSINLETKDAEIAIHVGNPEVPDMPSLAALEAMALLSEHGFSVMGLDRIHAGQAYPGLIGWNRMLEVLGYKSEGITRGTFKKGHYASDTVLIACTYKDYLRIRKLRGSLWGDSKTICKALRNLPRKSLAQKIDEAIKELSEEHFTNILGNN